MSRQTLITIAAGVWLLLFALVTTRVTGQEVPPPPPRPPGTRPGPPRLTEQDVQQRIRTVRERLAQCKPKSEDGERLISMARQELEQAEMDLRSNKLYAADRLQAASDAFLHAAEHSVHLEEGSKGPTPQPVEIAEHLQRIYFRLQQVDFFASTSGDTDAKLLPGLARKFYEQARKAYDDGSWFAADEYAKSADDTTRGLENMAQAAAPPGLARLR